MINYSNPSNKDKEIIGQSLVVLFGLVFAPSLCIIGVLGYCGYKAFKEKHDTNVLQAEPERAE